MSVATLITLGVIAFFFTNLIIAAGYIVGAKDYKDSFIPALIATISLIVELGMIRPAATMPGSELLFSVLNGAAILCSLFSILSGLKMFPWSYDSSDDEATTTPEALTAPSETIPTHRKGNHSSATFPKELTQRIDSGGVQATLLETSHETTSPTRERALITAE